MNLDETRRLLDVIAELDRTPFPEGAALSWWPILQNADYGAAHQAVLEHFSGTMRDRRILPGDVRSRAGAIAEHRARVARKAIGPGPTRERVGSTGRPAEVLAELERARELAAAAERAYRAALAESMVSA